MAPESGELTVEIQKDLWAGWLPAHLLLNQAIESASSPYLIMFGD
jgi:hypothetical protein